LRASVKPFGSGARILRARRALAFFTLRAPLPAAEPEAGRNAPFTRRFPALLQLISWFSLEAESRRSFAKKRGFWLIHGAFRAAPDWRLALEVISWESWNDFQWRPEQGESGTGAHEDRADAPSRKKVIL